jgi:midasin
MLWFFSCQTIDTTRLQRILLAYYRMLQSNRELADYLSWPLEPLSTLVWEQRLDPGTRLLAVKCYALQCGMGELEREKIEREAVGDISEVNCPLKIGEDVEGTPVLADGWIIPALEADRIRKAREEMLSSYEGFSEKQDDEIIQTWELRYVNSSPLATNTFELNVVSPFVADIHGILMFRQPDPLPRSDIVPTQTTISALQLITLNISLRLPVLMTSSPASGKSVLLSHIAKILHSGIPNQIITISLGDTSLDARSLLGSYTSSSTNPGTFEWCDGILVRAMQSGRWLLFKDIDRASNEILGTIKPLIESMGSGKWIGGRARLYVPNRGEVVATENFAVFATRSMQPTRKGTFPKPIFFGAHKFAEVVLGDPTFDELCVIIDSRFTKLAGVASKGIVNMWDAIVNLRNTSSGRVVGLRELMKFCNRVEKLLPASYHPMDIEFPVDSYLLPKIFVNPTLREDIYVEARDVFFGAGTSTAAALAHVEAVASLIAEHLDLSPERSNWIITSRSVEIRLERDVNDQVVALRAGNVLLPSARRPESLVLTKNSFAMHRQATSLIARIATAVSLEEPVLLTGETGTGKTSAITYMARTLRRPLVSLNLSQQTESSDLLGGFKPIDARESGTLLQKRFLGIFRDTFSHKKNTKFEESVARAVRDGKWKRAIGLWRESIRMAKGRIQSKLSDLK